MKPVLKEQGNQMNGDSEEPTNEELSLIINMSLVHEQKFFWSFHTLPQGKVRTETGTGIIWA